MTPPWRNEKVKLLYQRAEVKASIEIILSVFTVTGLLLLAIRPTLATVAELQKKIEDQRVVARKLDAKISQLVTAQRNLTAYASRLKDYDSAVPVEHDQGALAKRVELLTYEQGLAVNNIFFSAVPLLGTQINLTDKKGVGSPETEFEGKVAVFDLNFDLSGNPNRVFSFLTALEKMDRLVFIDEVDIKKEAEAGKSQAAAGVKVVGRARGYYVFDKEKK